MENTDALAALGALSQETRLDIFRFLVEVGPAGLPAGQIGERFALPWATLSFHLSQMKQAGLVTFRRDGRSLIYSADYERMNDLIAYLTENCCGGRPEACRPRPAASTRKTKGAKHEAHARPRRGA